MRSYQRKITISDIVLLLLLGLCLVFEFCKFEFVKNDEILNQIIFVTITRCLAGLFFVVLIVKNKLSVLDFKHTKKFLITLPCFLVAINNMPILSLISGNCRVEASFLRIFLFTLECLSVGFFEELAFRGLLFTICLQGHHRDKKAVFRTLVITSCVFGLYHLVNLTQGAGLLPTLEQVGYSALVGAMCGAVLLFSGNILYPILLHAIYNFCGTIVPTLGSGDWWDLPTIIITVVLSVCVFVYMLVAFFRQNKFALVENNYEK